MNSRKTIANALWVFAVLLLCTNSQAQEVKKETTEQAPYVENAPKAEENAAPAVDKNTAPKVEENITFTAQEPVVSEAEKDTTAATATETSAQNVKETPKVSQQDVSPTNEKVAPPPPATTKTDANTSIMATSSSGTTVTQQPVSSEIGPVQEQEKKRLENEKKRHLFVVTYNMANPGGGTADFIDEFSFEGFGFGYRFLLKKKLSVGAVFGWNTFEKKQVGQFSLGENTTISGTRIKMADIIQLAPTVHYYFATQSARAIPFIGLNMGPFYTSQVVDWGWWYEKEATWQFGFSPEIGIRIGGLPVPLYLAVRYSFAFKANTVDAQRFLGLNIGIAFLK